MLFLIATRVKTSSSLRRLDVPRRQSAVLFDAEANTLTLFFIEFTQYPCGYTYGKYTFWYVLMFSYQCTSTNDCI